MFDLKDFEPSTFPRMPHDGYKVSTTERIDLIIADHKDGSVINVVPSLTAAWGTVLASYTDSDDVLFGLAPPQSAVRSCPLRLQREGPVIAALNQAEDVISESDKTLDGFQNVLVIRDDGDESLDESGISYPLAIVCRIRKEGVQIQAIFDSMLLVRETVQMMLFQLRHAFTRIIQNPKVALAELQATSPEGLEKILHWNTATAAQRNETLCHRLIEQRCEEQPSAPAVCAWDGTLTYAELDAQASRLANQLVEAGVGPDRFVGLLMEKSMWTTVAILAVMKAGGALTLMDASQPVQRLALMRRKAQPRVLLVSPNHAAVAGGLDVPVLMVPGIQEQDETSTTAYSQTEIVRPHNSLYAGFTSGSTGEPKGFVMDHTAFCSGLDAYCEQSGLTSQSRVFQFASHAFIISLTDQIAPLTQGACVCLPSEDQLQNDLAGAIRELNANWAKLTPSVLHLLEPADIPGLQTLITVGEPMDTAELTKWQRSGVSLLSLYGLSENSKGGMFASRNDSSCDSCRFNRPFCATPWVVSRHDPNILMPIGAEGEMLFEGPCVSKGYIDNEEQNRMIFLEDTAWLKQVRPDGRGRFLRTGDLVRYNPKDGALHLLGRKGTRIKIRGQRVELSEIEYQLHAQFDDVKEPVVVEVVVPSDDSQRDPMLVAFVPVEKPGPSLQYHNRVENLFVPPSKEFRQKAQTTLLNLSKVLPSFMVPSAIVTTTALPRTPTGKLHRRLLREKASKLCRKDLLAYTSNEAAHQDPITEQEIFLQRVCAEVLGLPPNTIGMQANFLDLGGNSILARHLVTQVRKSGLYITVADVLRQPYLSTLALCHQSCCDSAAPVFDDVAMDPFEDIQTDLLANLPASLDAADIEDVLPTHDEQEYMAAWPELDYHLFELTGSVDADRLHRACQALVTNHTILRSVFVPFRDTMLQVVLRHVDVVFSVQTSTDQDALSCALAYREADLQQPYRADKPRLEFKLVQDAPEHSILHFRILHAQYDAVCLPRLLSDLWAAYDGQDIHVVSDYSDYARECSRQRKPAAYHFWQDLLKGSKITPAPVREVPVPDEQRTAFEVDIPLLTPPAGITVATVIKAAWAIVLQEYTGTTDDLVFGQFVNTRNLSLPGIDDIVGPCFNVIPVRVPRSMLSSSMYDLLRTIQSQHAECIDFETIGWRDMFSQRPGDPTVDLPGSVVKFQNFIPEPERQIGRLHCRKLPHILCWR
ncbi:putative nonribosomal peptide synthase [Aspergillus glaucus CBS 516.65]|uniref:Carrier domain-containing protein n=1 Tax=Aspergillus glaucus CBS 516.65 TaxID=1160497 RepID=A0A1L9VX51_ASPGL|nr:hypothetical protein ASPGLDRAFT_712366 [Aspergillus glaucus CBS 516.65]OJJ88491.1 hypothetical protein ASPGLDRAFT_712366 [Aspergillus glaucus CBS 516.65]